jgi:transposase
MRNMAAKTLAKHGLSNEKYEGDRNDTFVKVACTRFRRHRVRCFDGAGGGVMERRKFTREFKLEAVRLIKDRGVSYVQASQDLNVHTSQLRDWVKKFSDDPQHAFPGNGQMKPEQLEIARLKREVAKLKAERDILKKAAAYFAREST